MFTNWIYVVFLIVLHCHLYILAFSQCPKPHITNGNYSLTFFNRGHHNISVAQFEPNILAIFNCKSNYTLSGRKRNTCINGRWVHKLPLCHENVLECVAPKVQKGWVECLTLGCNRFYVGTEAAIRCERGYRLQGSSRMQCQLQMATKPSWSSPVPKCVLIEADFNEAEQDRQPFNMFYTENSSIMIIIIILSVLAGGLMLLMSIMLMNRLFQRRRLMRIQRTDNAFNHQPATAPGGASAAGGAGGADIPNGDGDRNIANFPVFRETSRDPPVRWNCFRTFASRNSRYQHMDSQTTEPVNNLEQDYNQTENFEIYDNCYNDDQTSLILPPCYEEAVKCSQYSIVASKNAIDQQKLKGSRSKPKSNLSLSTDKDSRESGHRQVNSNSLANDTSGSINQSISSIPNTSMQSKYFHNSSENKNYSQSNVAVRSNDMDNISRRSARAHCPRVTNNITSESNVSFRSGSIETMAISDGTSVTVHTLDSRGSNPSLGSMRPQTGSIGDPTNYVNNCPTQYRHPLGLERSSTPFTENDLPAPPESRYSPPPSYECSINNPIIIKGRYNHSNTASPGTNSSVALFVDNMACTEDLSEETASS